MSKSLKMKQKNSIRLKSIKKELQNQEKKYNYDHQETPKENLLNMDAMQKNQYLGNLSKHG